jgi:hypothetical protein
LKKTNAEAQRKEGGSQRKDQEHEGDGVINNKLIFILEIIQI